MAGSLRRVIERALAVCSAAILFALMLLTFVDVVGRDTINAPLPGGFEMTEMMMAALIFAALPLVSRREEHVVIDLFDGITPAPAAAVRHVVVNLVGAAALGVIAWRCWTLAGELAGYHEVTEYLRLPVAPIVYLIAVLSGLAALVHVDNALHRPRARGAAEMPTSEV